MYPLWLNTIIQFCGNPSPLTWYQILTFFLASANLKGCRTPLAAALPGRNPPPLAAAPYRATVSTTTGRRPYKVAAAALDHTPERKSVVLRKVCVVLAADLTRATATSWLLLLVAAPKP
jgi:hypothetical protein